MKLVNYLFIKIFLFFSHSVIAQNDSVDVSFQLKFSKGDSVSIAGSFNRWNPGSHYLTRDGSVWKTVLRLTPGYHYYKFIVNGKWIHDPKNSWKINDGSGGFNSIIKVGEPLPLERKKSEHPFPRDKLPKPILEANAEYVDLYYLAWEIAWNKIAYGSDQNGFSERYMDEGFDEFIYQWDTCFMAAFGMYARHLFPAMSSIDNFYNKQQADGSILRIYSEVTGESVGKPDANEPLVNPPLFAWIELRYFYLSGDSSRLQRVLPILVRYFQWIEQHCQSPHVAGLYYTTPLGSGMDNLPRNDITQGAWIDFSAQQALSAKSIATIARVVNDSKIENEFLFKHQQMADSINSRCWNEDRQFYFDVTVHDSLCRSKHIGAFWTLLAGVVTQNRDQLLVNHLLNPKQFWRQHVVPCLPANDPHYNERGHYWRGGVWAPTNYMLVKGLEEYGFYELADEVALNHVYNMESVYYLFQPDKEKLEFAERYEDGYFTIWESYSPDLVEPAMRWDNTFYVRQDFVGWSGLGPIALLIENILGIHIVGSENTIHWRIHRQDTHGIENIQLRDQFVSLNCRPRYNRLEIEITATKPFLLKIEWRDIHIEKEITKPGITRFEIR